ncbi:uncharacterized protein OCT59_009866 [Rhizophagus irregularis]|nr:hypothetical protein OCT59_009866 [Rhizophagus irregularis]GBC29258.2 hypothetical protein GLOIN_2v1881622 [Rhizophagus irregularis DAOM 181602=DAOM 197198]CAB4491825.1 unnamed protein product [Rhizophagus irregularis]
MEMDEVVDRNYSHEEIKDLEQKYFELEADNKRISNELANEFSKVRDSYRVRFDEKLVAENEKLKDKVSTSSKVQTIIQRYVMKMINSKFISKIYQRHFVLKVQILKKVTTDYEVMCNEYDKLKIHFENENLKNKNKQNNHSLLYNEITNLKIQNKEYKKTLSTLRSEKEVLANQLAELVVENKKLKDKISTSSKSLNN